MTQPPINGIAPCFLVRRAPNSVSFYREKLGFDLLYQVPEGDNFFGMVGRGGAMLMVQGGRR